MDIGIYILSYNRKEELKVVLDSIYSLLDSEVSEIFLLDQGSTDGTDKLVNTRFPRINSHFSKKNLGVAGGRDFLFKRARSEICIFLDDDSYFQNPGDINQIATAFENNSELDFVSLNIVDQKGSMKDWPHSRGLKRKSNQNWVAMNFVGCGHAIRRTSYLACGGYQTNDKFYAEELDLVFKMFSYRKKLSGMYLGDIKVVHLASPKSRLYWNSDRLFYRVKNRSQYYLNSFSLQSPFTFLFLLVFSVSDLRLAIKHKNFQNFWRGLRAISIPKRSRMSFFESITYQIIHVTYLLGNERKDL
jgi:GT2 family glycosyltransferase